MTSTASRDDIRGIFSTCMRQIIDDEFGKGRATVVHKPERDEGYAYIPVGDPDDYLHTHRQVVHYGHVDDESVMITFDGRDFTDTQFESLARTFKTNTRIRVFPSTRALMICDDPTEDDIRQVIQAWNVAMAPDVF